MSCVFAVLCQSQQRHQDVLFGGGGGGGGGGFEDIFNVIAWYVCNICLGILCFVLDLNVISWYEFNICLGTFFLIFNISKDQDFAVIVTIVQSADSACRR